MLPLCNSWINSGKTNDDLLKRIIAIRDAHPEHDWQKIGLGEYIQVILDAEAKLTATQTQGGQQKQGSKKEKATFLIH